MFPENWAHKLKVHCSKMSLLFNKKTENYKEKCPLNAVLGEDQTDDRELFKKNVKVILHHDSQIRTISSSYGSKQVK